MTKNFHVKPIGTSYVIRNHTSKSCTRFEILVYHDFALLFPQFPFSLYTILKKSKFIQNALTLKKKCKPHVCLSRWFIYLPTPLLLPPVLDVPTALHLPPSPPTSIAIGYLLRKGPVCGATALQVTRNCIVQSKNYYFYFYIHHHCDYYMYYYYYYKQFQF